MNKIKWLSKRLPLLLGVLMAADLTAQGNYYTFTVQQEGVYKITAEQATQLGARSVDELTVYGYPGVLPQVLDKSSLELLEIPVKNISGELFLFLSAAEQMAIDEGEVRFLPHHYTDTLRYLVQTGRAPSKSVTSLSLPVLEQAPDGILYRPVIYKNPQYNILSSGRDWYGERVFDGESIILNYEESATSTLPIYYQGRVMAQSLGASTFTFSLNQTEVATFSIPSIPNSTYGIKGRPAEKVGKFVPDNGGPPQVKLHFQTENRNGTGYLDYFMVGYPAVSTELPVGVFHNFDRLPFGLQPHPDYRVWNVSGFQDVTELTASGPSLSTDDKLAVFDPNTTPALSDFRPVDMNLRLNPRFTELIIISHPVLATQAQRLSDFKNSSGTSSQVVMLSDIYSSFGYGNPDVSAIRNFLAFHYHNGKKLTHVLLFGKGTFDYKKKLGGRPNWVPAYSSRSSLNPLTTYSSDDYFGFLEFGKGEWEEEAGGDHLLDIGVGRLPVINSREAKNVVDKSIQYSSQSRSKSDWKRKVLLVADDGDNNVHLKDSESLADHLAQHHPELLVQKLYLDSFEQSRSGNVQQSPDAKKAFETALDSSSLVVNYIGHGNETTLMAEELFTVSDLNNWRENNKLPVIVTATCEFGRHDSPLIRSGAEELLIAENKGAIALLTTGRPVFSNINFALNEAFMREVFRREEGRGLTLGEIYRRTKNNSLNGALNRNFSLLGDPSLRLALPDLTIELEEIATMNGTETLQALQPIHYSGKIVDPLTGAEMNSFEGNLEIRVSAPPPVQETKGDESQATTYWDDQDVLFKGAARIDNGRFQGGFILPSAPIGTLKELTIRLFAQDEQGGAEALGSEKINFKAYAEPGYKDSQGPKIKLSLKPPYDSPPLSSTWVEMIVELSDSSGIYLRPDKSISLQINGGAALPLHEYYRAEGGSYQQGRLDFPVKGLQEGENTLLFEAFDNQGNRSEQLLEVWVNGSNRISILSHQLFPNPADQFTQFRLTHNRPGEHLLLGFEIYSLSGSKIFSQSLRFPKADPILQNVAWFFMHGKSNFPAKGTYLYTLELQSEVDGTSDIKRGKLLIQ